MFEIVRSHAANGVAFALASVIAGPVGVGSKALYRLDGTLEAGTMPSNLSARVALRSVELLRAEHSDTIELQLPEGHYSVFIAVYPGAPRLVIVGASHAAVPLSAFAKALGYEVFVTDARATFAESSRFPSADHVLQGWPQDVLPTIQLNDSTYVVLLSHDPKFDEPTLRHVLPSEVRYVGAIGSRRTQRARFDRLRVEGFSEEQLARLYGPVGLDLGGQSPEETALAILAEITAVRYGRAGGHLRPEIMPASDDRSAT